MSTPNLGTQNSLSERQLQIYKSCVSLLVDAQARDTNKADAAKELSSNLEHIIELSRHDPQFFETTINTFIKVLEETRPQFVSDYPIQIMRKSLLEMIQRLPPNELIETPTIIRILKLMFTLFEVENEENVQVILRIIIELHKTLHKNRKGIGFMPETQSFLDSVKSLYSDMQKTYDLNKIFDKKKHQEEDLTPALLDQYLANIHTLTIVETQKRNEDKAFVSYSILPRAKQSLKVLADLPIIVVLLYQIHKTQLQQTAAEFIPLIMNTITLRPPDNIKNSEKFDTEIYVEFITAQIKALSFIAYIVRIYEGLISSHSNQLVQGMLMLLKDCPHEVASLRKELLAAVRHILQTSLKTKFISHISYFFDESVLTGKGWTARESLRPIAYNTLADLVHHVRQDLSITDLAAAVNAFSKNVHDDTIPPYIQSMSCKLLLTLAESASKKFVDKDAPYIRELLMRLIEVYVLKFKVIATLHLPILFQRLKAQQAQATNEANAAQANTNNSGSFIPQRDTAFTIGVGEVPPSREEKPKFEFPMAPSQNYSIADCKSMVKTLVVGVKTVTNTIPSYKFSGITDQLLVPAGAKVFQPRDTIVFVRLVKYALRALDIYMLAPSGQTLPHGMMNQMNRQQFIAQQNSRSKEEKEILEHFAGIFTALHPLTFHEIFSKLIDFLVERMHQNFALQVIVNSFLATSPTSPIFATILLEYLLVRMEEIGSNVEKSNLYLRLFKMVFGSVSLYAVENEQMLKPHLHNIVNKSMELALGAKDPYNYFLLLRALFRSIGGGSHDLLYQEFLPLLPNLLQGLNSLQSGLHKQHIKDLFVELCLTVPVRLSSLLPYLPMLMDPLVSALNGSQTLISQGLRTLELCVDNLQPDFLYEHIQPVRAELMQALWRTLRHPSSNIASTSFRVLGKFGGGNRKMMIEPQRLKYLENKEGFTTQGSSVVIFFPDQRQSINLPIDKVIYTAYENLKQLNIDPDLRHQCWNNIKSVVVSNCGILDVPEQKQKIKQFFGNPALATMSIPSKKDYLYKCQDVELRKVHQTALAGMFMAAAVRECDEIFLNGVVLHYVMVAIYQQLSDDPEPPQGMDPYVLIDALATIFGYEEKELCKPAHDVLDFIIEKTALLIWDDTKERAYELPYISYLVRSMYKLCYERAWYSKMGGCIAIKYFFEHMPLVWVLKYQKKFAKALLYVMRDLTGEVSSGAVDMAQANLERMLNICGQQIDVTNSETSEQQKNLIEFQTRSLNDVTELLVREVTSPNLCVRTQAMKSLETLAKLLDKSVTRVMEPHRKILENMIPLFASLTDHCLLEKQPVRTQIGLMHGTTFCSNLQPRLFTIDTNIEKHKDYIYQLIKICEGDDPALKRLPCYTKVTNLVPVRVAALQALSACHYLRDYEHKIFTLLYKSTESNNLELQETGYSCIKHFTDNVTIEPSLVIKEIKPLLEKLQDSSQWDLNSVRRIRYMTQLFPSVFEEDFCKSLAEHLDKLATAAMTDLRTVQRQGEHVYDRCKLANEKLKVYAGILEIFAQLPNVPPGIPEKIMAQVFKTEKNMLIEPGSPLREPLKKFLKKYATHAVGILLLPNNLVIEQIYRFIMFLLKGPDGEPFRMSMRITDNINKLTKYANGPFIDPYRQLINMTTLPDGSMPQQLQTRPAEFDCRFPAIAIISTLAKYDDLWLMTRPTIIDVLKRLWNTEDFHEKHSKIEHVDYMRWKEPKLVVKCLLNYFKHNNQNIELLFQLLRAFLGRYLCEFEFLRHFLEKTVIETYSIEWKRDAFFKFVTVFRNANYSQDLKAKILQLIIIPTFSHSFEKGLGDALIGGSPQPDNDENKNNLINVFMEIIKDILADDKNKCIQVSDSVRIILLQFSCLLVEQASSHIHPLTNKRQGNKLRYLMTFAWPCLLSKNCVDPATKYHGHLLLAHIISKFAVHSRIVLQVFHSLLKAYAPEARAVVRQALEVLTPAMPHRIEKGDNMNMLTLWTKKIITEEGHMLPQLVHMLQLLVRHFRVYYPVRNHLIQHMVSSIQRLGFAANVTIEHKRMAVDLCEVIIRWEMQRIREERERQAQGLPPHNPPSPSVLSKTPGPPNASTVSQTMKDMFGPNSPMPTQAKVNDASTPNVAKDSIVQVFKAETPDSSSQSSLNQLQSSPLVSVQSPQQITLQQQAQQQPLIQQIQHQHQSRQSPRPSIGQQMSQSSMNVPMMSLADGNMENNRMNLQEDCFKPLDPHYANEIINKLLQMACQVNELPTNTPSFSSSPGENLSKRCVMLLKSALKPDVWVNPDLSKKLLKWFAELLCSIEPRPQPCPPPNIGNICTALELLSFLANTLSRDVILNIFSAEDLQRGIIACINSCSTSKVIRSGSSLLQRLMSVFPPRSATSPSPSQYERLENLYTSVHNIILQGLNNYETAQQAPPSILFSTLMILKAACSNNPCYIDRLMQTFIRVLQKMTKEHLQPSAGEVSPMGSELLILSLDLVKNRISSMNQEMRKVFIQHILANLIERSTDVKVSKAITKIVEDWVKHKQGPSPTQTQGPNLREKTLLLIKLMYNIEKRDAHDIELIAQFLELINYVFRDDELKTTDLTTKLETAFMLGLRFVQPTIRAKFFQVFNQSVKAKLYERLMYIVCAQNWETIGHHYWIKQCIEFILVIALDTTPIKHASPNACLPSIHSLVCPTSLPSLLEVDGDSPSIRSMLISDTATIKSSAPLTESSVPMDVDGGDEARFRTITSNVKTTPELTPKIQDIRKRLLTIMDEQYKFYDDVKQINTGSLLQSLAQICHSDSQLAHDIWIQMFPKIWKVLNDSQMTLLGREIVPFLCSGSHVKQIECHPSAIGTFMEAVSLCQPPIQIRPVLLRYLGKNHNLWQRAALMLEEMYKDKTLEITYPVSARSSKSNQQNPNDFDIIALNPLSTLAEEASDSLADLLELLHEEDLWCGLWQKRAQYKETLHAIAFEQQGMFEQAQECYEAAMNRQRIEFDNTYILKPGMKSENKLWERHWIKCSKELNQWDSLLEYGNSQHSANPILVMESAWRVPNWQMMREALSLVEANCPISMAWLVALYKGYNFICNRDEYDLQAVDAMINCSSDHCIKEWRKLPHIVSHAHIRLLHGAQRIMELYEALQLHTSFMPNPLTRQTNQVSHDMKAVVKTWRNRQPILSDDLSHWSDIFTWRQHHYQAIVAHYDAQSQQMAQTGQFLTPDPNASNAMLGVHASAQAIIQFGEIARRQGLINVCLDSINRIHTIPSVPIVDCFQKIRQQVKCYLQMPVSEDKAELLDGLEIIESTNLKYFAKDMIAEFYALKGMFLSQLERHDEANKSYSAAAQLHDMLPRAWAAWGEHMEGRFTQETNMDVNNPNLINGRQMELGVSAITCYLQACRHQTEPKSRKFLAKVLWLLSFDDERSQLAKTVEEYHGFVPATNWLAWIPQLLQCMLRNEGEHLRKLLIFIGRSYPQAVYFPTMTLFRTLKMYIHAFKLRNNSINSALIQQQQHQQQQQQQQQQLQQQQPTVSSSLQTTVMSPGPMMMGSPQSLQTNIMTAGNTMTLAQSNLLTTTCQQQTQQLQQQLPIQQQQQLLQPQQLPQQQLSQQLSQPQMPQQQQLTQQLLQPQQIPQQQLPQLLSHQPGASTSQQQMPILTSSNQPGQQPLPPQPNQRQQPMAPASLWRCSEIMKTQRDIHPTTLSSLEGIAEQMVWFRVYWYEEVQKQVQQALFKCYVLAFENRNQVANVTINQPILNYVKKLVTTFGVGITGNISSVLSTASSAASESLAERVQATSQDPEYQHTKMQFRVDFDEASLPTMTLMEMIGKLQKWIKILEHKTKVMPKTYLIEEKCRFLSNFSQHTADVELPGESLLPKHNHYYVRIARFMPEVEVISKHNTAARRIFIRGHNGKVYPYLVVSDSFSSDARREERVLQLMRLLNLYLVKRKETGRRFLNYTVPRVVAISPDMRLVEDNPASLSLMDIFKRRIGYQKHGDKDIDQDSPIMEYYERLKSIQATNMQATQRNLKDILSDIQNKLVSTRLFKDWASQTYVAATDYWCFRSQFTLQMSLASFSEYVLHFTRLNPDMMYIHQDSGLINVAYYKFDVDDRSGDIQANRAVPFRLTHNISEFMTLIGVVGPFTASMIAVSRCLLSPNFKVDAILKAILRDEMLDWYKTSSRSCSIENQMQGDLLVTMVNKAVRSILGRMHSLASLDKPLESKTSCLVDLANSNEQLCQMDPSWHPWL